MRLASTSVRRFTSLLYPRVQMTSLYARLRALPAIFHRLADWLAQVGITTIAMESTSVYWIPVFEILEARGFEVVLVNARDAKNVPGRKTDVNDAQWICQLHTYGLLRGSFRPQEQIVALR